VISRIYDDALAAVDLKGSQFTLLVAVASRGKRKPADLASSLHMDESTVSRNVERMFARGWLRLEADSDGRSHLITVTDEGQARIRAGYPAWQAAQARATALLGEDSVAALKSAVKKLSAKNSSGESQSVEKLSREKAKKEQLARLNEKGFAEFRSAIKKARG
jgi:DNA-binding MarR family transcriptional regulator